MDDRSYQFYVIDEMITAGAHPGTIGWIANVIRRHCPTAKRFYCIDLAVGLVRVVIEAAESTLSKIVDVQADLSREAYAGIRFEVEYTRTSRKPSGVYQLSPYVEQRPTTPPTAADVNAMQDGAVREIQQRDAEIERLRAENEKLRAEENGRSYYKLRMTTAHEHIERLKAELKRVRRVALTNAGVATVLDEQTRFLAGLDDRRWSVPDRERRRTLVREAIETLRSDRKVIG